MGHHDSAALPSSRVWNKQEMCHPTGTNTSKGFRGSWSCAVNVKLSVLSPLGGEIFNVEALRDEYLASTLFLSSTLTYVTCSFL